MIAGEYFDYADALEKEQGVSGCPMECPKSRKRFDPKRNELCKTCPRKRHLDYFKEETLERWQQWFGKQAKEFDFNGMLKTFYNVMLFEDLVDEVISVKNASLRTTLLSERAKARARQNASPAAVSVSVLRK